MALEGAPFWLCRLLEGAFQANATIIFSGEAFDEGYYLINIQWLEFVNVDSANQRRYRLGEERMLSVHSLVRFRALKILETSADASRGRSRTTKPNKPFLLPATSVVLSRSALRYKKIFESLFSCRF